MLKEWYGIWYVSSSQKLSTVVSIRVGSIQLCTAQGFGAGSALFSSSVIFRYFLVVVNFQTMEFLFLIALFEIWISDRHVELEMVIWRAFEFFTRESLMPIEPLLLFHPTESLNWWGTVSQTISIYHSVSFLLCRRNREWQSKLISVCKLGRACIDFDS